MDGFAEFEFDLPSALQEQLVKLLDNMATGSLVSAVTDNVPEASGVYQLHYGGELVYIGKTDAEAGLRKRLSRHAKKILHRPDLTWGVDFKAVRIFVFTAIDLETQLIKHYRRSGPVSWNGSGFGSNDPGRERETTNRRPEGFDATYPISIDIPLGQLLPPGPISTIEALKTLKSTLPYTLRYETERSAEGRAQPERPHPDLIARMITVPTQPQTTREIMQLIVRALGSDWQATVFASHVILYKENRTYDFGSPI
jgi:hypothetical protein